MLAHTLAQSLPTRVNPSSYLRVAPPECAWQMDSGQEVHQDVKVGGANLQLCLLLRKLCTVELLPGSYVCMYDV